MGPRRSPPRMRGPLLARRVSRPGAQDDRAPVREMPEHIDQAVRSIAQLHSEHHGRTKASQRLVNQISAAIARPLFVGLLAVGVLAWIAADLPATGFRGRAIDPPAFPWLQGAVNLFSLFMVTLVLVAQKHEDELNAHREILARARDLERTQDRQSDRASGGTAPRHPAGARPRGPAGGSNHPTSRRPLSTERGPGKQSARLRRGALDLWNPASIPKKPGAQSDCNDPVPEASRRAAFRNFWVDVRSLTRQRNCLTFAVGRANFPTIDGRQPRR